MNTVEILNEKCKDKMMLDMKEGEVGVVTSGTYKGSIVFRMFGNYAFSLNDYMHYWDTANRAQIPVRILPNGTEIKITIGGN